MRVTFFSAAGALLGAPQTLTLGPGAWAQINAPLSGTGAAAGYAKVEKTSGSSRFAAYGVLNDAATSDGSYLPMQ